ncbi:coiled-coil domain-containing protein 120 isoform X2 [Amphiprion ocellaris]|uniref:coiled-coil domain-containing protein 120 isoform X2 n=1 Tax=Amphiprion ocellaris TaxID=80972 RepID=UPI002411774E|nr:coiled-coil domain-containing protein 120 isoform X2 [Amphiprion ocellaris]
MATGVNYWSSDEPRYKVSPSVWAGEQEWSSEDGGGGVTWETQAMEVTGQLISPDPLTCLDRKQRERIVELQEKRRSLQTLLSTRLAELRRICLQEAELTGAVPSEFPLEAGEKPPYIRRRGGTSRHGTRKCRVEDDDSQRSKLKKTLFSGALRKHSDSEHNAHNRTHTHHGKRTVHRGCHTDEGVSQCRLPLVSASSPVDVFYQNRTRRNSVHIRSDHPETQKPLPLPPLQPPPPPPRSQDSSSSSGPSDPGAGSEGSRTTAAHRSNSSDGLLDRMAPQEEEGGAQQGGLWVNGVPESRGAGRGRGGRGYGDVLLDYVWGKQQQLQRQQSHGGRQPITSQHQLYNGYSTQQGAPPTYRSHHSDQRRVTVTRTKSCGPFLPAQQTDTHNAPLPAIQPDPHPHLLPPAPPQLPPSQDSQLEEATRSLHKALALEGLRDWYLRNTVGSSNQNQVNSKAAPRVSRGVKGQHGGGGALQCRRTTHGVIQPSTYQTETSQHHAATHHKPTLPHSATFHGQPLTGRSVAGSLYHKKEVPLREPAADQPSPGTLV